MMEGKGKSEEPLVEAAAMPESGDWYIEHEQKLIRQARKLRRIFGLSEEPEELLQEFLSERGEKLRTNGYEDGQIRKALKCFLIDRARHRQRERKKAEGYEYWSREELRRKTFQRSENPQPRIGPSIPHREGERLLRSLGEDSRTKVDYGAVLLLTERLEVACRFASIGEKADVSPSRFAERVYPWEEDVGHRVILPVSGTLNELWKDLGPIVDGKGIVAKAEIAACVGVCARTLYRWLHRARQRLVEEVGPGAVKACFPSWRIVKRSER